MQAEGITIVGSNMVEDLGLDLPAISYGFIRGIAADAIVIVDLAGGEHGLKPLEPLYQAIYKRNPFGSLSLKVAPCPFRNTSLHYQPRNVVDKADSNKQPEFLCVFNIFRPLTNTKEKMLTYLDKVNTLSPWQITGIVNNSNLLQDTETNHILHGQEILLQIAEERGIPLRYTQLKRTNYQQIHHQIQSEQVILFDQLQMRENWQ